MIVGLPPIVEVNVNVVPVIVPPNVALLPEKVKVRVPLTVRVALEPVIIRELHAAAALIVHVPDELLSKCTISFVVGGPDEPTAVPVLVRHFTSL